MKKNKCDKITIEQIINDFYQNNDIINYLIDEDDDYLEINNNYQIEEDKLMELTTIVLDIYREIYSELSLSEIQEVKYKIMEKIQERLKYEINKLQSPKYNIETLDKLEKQIKFLDTIPQPAQRTPEWYTFRNNRLTASDLGTAMNINPYSQMEKLIMKKCGEEMPFVTNSAITHGVKFEDVAIAVYQQRNRVIVKEYGCIPHPEIEFFGASPDGIVNYESENKNYVARMLEIKCPKSRPQTGFPPNYYEAQVQGQLEVCDLEWCDFLECDIKEYRNRDEFIKDCNDSYSKDSEDYIQYRKNNMEKGAILEIYNQDLKKMEYKYPNIDFNLEQLDKWIEDNIDIILDSDNLEYVNTTYWKLDKYTVTLIKRDRDWFLNKAFPCIENFWNQVLYYREHGIDKLHTKIKDAKIKKQINKQTGNSQSIEKFIVKSPGPTDKDKNNDSDKDANKKFVLDENIDFRDTINNDKLKKKNFKKDYLDKFDFLD